VAVRVRVLTLFVVAVLTGGVFFAGYGAGHRAAARSADDQGYALLRQILTHVRRDYLNPVPDATALFDGSARGMLDALGDPYTRYMGGKAFREFQEGVQGVFFGIGIFIDMRDKQLIVVQPIEGTPAFRAGLRAGDKIQRINNAPTESMALQEAVSKIRGPAGTKVTLPGGEVVKARSLSGKNGLLFIRNSVTGAVEIRRRQRIGVELNAELHAN